MSIGYEGLNIEYFLACLKANLVDTIVDIREIPISHKAGFSKTALAMNANREGIAYVHYSSLGCPKVIRHDYRADKDWIRYTRRFLEYMMTQGQEIRKLSSLVREKNCCLLCFEADHHHCHRRFIADELQQLMGTGLTVMHLEPMGKAVVPSQRPWAGISAQQ